MSLFLKELSHFNKFYWLFLALMTITIVGMTIGLIWIVLYFDMGILITASIFYLQRSILNKKKRLRIDLWLDKTEQRRKILLFKKIAEDSGFITLCHECLYFNQELLFCELEIFERKPFFKLENKSNFRYCLYWNIMLPKFIEKSLWQNKSRANKEHERNEGTCLKEHVK